MTEAEKTRIKAAAAMAERRCMEAAAASQLAAQAFQGMMIAAQNVADAVTEFQAAIAIFARPGGVPAPGEMN